MFDELFSKCEAFRQFLFIVGHHDERLTWQLTVGLDDILDQLSVLTVEPMKGFIENQQLGRFDEGTSQQHQALFATGELQERALLHSVDAEDMHPPATLFALSLIGTGIESHGIFQSAGHHLNGWDIMLVGTVHLGRHITDAALDVPDGLATASLFAEEADVAGVGLRIVGTYQRE